MEKKVKKETLPYNFVNIALLPTFETDHFFTQKFFRIIFFMKYRIGEWSLVQITTQRPPIVEGASAVLHPFDPNVMVLFGGQTSLFNANTATNQLWFYFFGIFQFHFLVSELCWLSSLIQN
jgi:hypothetical protein